MLKITLPNKVKLSDEAQRRLVELIYFLDPRIQVCRTYDSPKSSGQIELELEGISSQDLQDGALEKKICALSQELADSYDRVETHVYFETQGEGKYSEDPHPHLLDSKQMVETSPGVFLYQGALRSLMQKLDQAFKAWALELGACELDCPDTVPLSSLQQNGYLGAYPHHASFVSLPKPELGAVSDLTNLEAPVSVLTPTVCYPCFEALRGQRVSESGLSLTAVSKCHRREHKTHRGLERLQTFTMREWIVIGSEAWVNSQLDQMLAKVQSAVEKWGLGARLVSATDPFFAGEAFKKRSYQSLLGLKKELQLWLPYSNQWVAAGSFNFHRDTLVKSYGVSSETSSPVFSACVGFGLERFTLAVLAQYGLEPKHWPQL